MSLVIPTNIATRESVSEILCELMRSLPGPLTFHVCDGVLSGHRIEAGEIEDAARGIAQCSYVYILEGTRARLEPIAGFIANESLGRAQLLHLIDARPASASANLRLRTADMLGVYIRWMFKDHAWLNAVTVPGIVDSLDGFHGLKVASGDISTVTLAESGHRPFSSRNWS